MRALVGTDIGSYAFDASAKTVTFIGCGNVKLEDIDYITNVTLGVEIYNHEEKTGTINNNVLSLTYVTSAMNDTDKLQIYIEIPYGIYIPKHNKQVITEVSATETTIEYYDATTLLATKTIGIDGSVTTIEMAYE